MNLSNLIESRGGRITFADFMEQALYHPKRGFYRSGQVQFGENGDFITHPDLCSPFFARALVRQIASMWNEMERPKHFDLIEMGAGNGTLAKDFLYEAKLEFPAFYGALKMVLIEISPELIRQQQRKIPRSYHHKIEFIQGSVLDYSWQEIRGCVLSNELFDSLPVHKVRQIDHRLAEIYVTWDKAKRTFHEVSGPLSTPEIQDYFNRLRINLDPGQEFYVNLNAMRLIKNIALAIQEGYHLVIDYGTTADHLIAEDLCRLYTFKKHVRGSYPYKDLGKTDLTSTVDFSSLVLAGQEEHLSKLLYLDEYRYFKHWLGWKRDFDSGYEATKILENFFHDGFKVLIQGKNVPELK